MNDSANPNASPKLPTRLSVLELMVPLSFDYFAWLHSTGIEHQPGPENKMPWGINALKLPQAMRDPRNDSGLNIEEIPVQGQRKFRSRSPAPAMIPQADIHEISEGTVNVCQVHALEQVDANMPTQSSSCSSHGMISHRGLASTIRRPRIFRSRSPAPAMIPRAIDACSSHDFHVHLSDANACDDAREVDDMPPLVDELTDQVLPLGSFDNAHSSTLARADAVSTDAENLRRGHAMGVWDAQASGTDQAYHPSFDTFAR